MARRRSVSVRIGRVRVSSSSRGLRTSVRLPGGITISEQHGPTAAERKQAALDAYNAQRKAEEAAAHERRWEVTTTNMAHYIAIGDIPWARTALTTLMQHYPERARTWELAEQVAADDEELRIVKAMQAKVAAEQAERDAAAAVAAQAARRKDRTVALVMISVFLVLTALVLMAAW